ncbi:MAG: DUF2007 domain-containing protein [Planctomycetota bacterium]
MTDSKNTPVLLLAAPSWQTGQLAKNLLEAEGIPVILHGMDRDLAELGSAVHDALSRPDVLVPQSAFDRANEILDEAWGSEWREDSYEEEE